MYNPGYSSYQDPRLQPPEEPERDMCGDCTYYRDVCSYQPAKKTAHRIGVCIFEVFQANTFEHLAKADLTEVDPTDEPCRNFKEDK